jgi:hypothetical protein
MGKGFEEITSLKKENKWPTSDKTWSTALLSRTVQIKVLMKCHLTFIKVTNIKKHSKCW